MSMPAGMIHTHTHRGTTHVPEGRAAEADDEGLRARHNREASSQGETLCIIMMKQHCNKFPCEITVLQPLAAELPLLYPYFYSRTTVIYFNGLLQ